MLVCCRLCSHVILPSEPVTVVIPPDSTQAYVSHERCVIAEIKTVLLERGR